MTTAIVNKTKINWPITTLQPLRYSLLTALCGALLVAGFFFAARQHFSSMDYSIRNSRLRKQLDELEAEKRRLLLAKEISLSPAELMKAAKRIGYRDTAAASTISDGQMRPAQAAAVRSEPIAAIVKKTVISEPVGTSSAKNDKGIGQAKKVDSSKAKRTQNF